MPSDVIFLTKENAPQAIQKMRELFIEDPTRDIRVEVRYDNIILLFTDVLDTFRNFGYQIRIDFDCKMEYSTVFVLYLDLHEIIYDCYNITKGRYHTAYEVITSELYKPLTKALKAVYPECELFFFEDKLPKTTAGYGYSDVFFYITDSKLTGNLVEMMDKCDSSQKALLLGRMLGYSMESMKGFVQASTELDDKPE